MSAPTSPFSALSFVAGLFAGTVLGACLALAIRYALVRYWRRRNRHSRRPSARHHQEIVDATPFTLPVHPRPMGNIPELDTPFSSTFSFDSGSLPLPPAFRDAGGKFIMSDASTTASADSFDAEVLTMRSPSVKTSASRSVRTPRGSTIGSIASLRRALRPAPLDAFKPPAPRENVFAPRAPTDPLSPPPDPFARMDPFAPPFAHAPGRAPAPPSSPKRAPSAPTSPKPVPPYPLPALPPPSSAPTSPRPVPAYPLPALPVYPPLPPSPAASSVFSESAPAPRREKSDKAHRLRLITANPGREYVAEAGPPPSDSPREKDLPTPPPYAG